MSNFTETQTNINQVTDFCSEAANVPGETFANLVSVAQVKALNNIAAALLLLVQK